MRRVHFIGIGGVGMNGLAQLAAKSGYKVSGSDRACNPDSEPFNCLGEMGISFYPQDGSSITTETDQVVFSTAIESDNPDLMKAKELRIPLLHRSEFLKQLVGDAKLVAVAGTAGKTTTTGLLGWIFECLGLDPWVYNGASVLNWKTGSNLGNVRKGNSNLWIIEADESDKSFLNFHPMHSIITNISKDHYELDELHRMFDQFESQTSGITVHGTKSRTGILPVYPESDAPVECRQARCPSYFSMLGKHNLENALCAFDLCMKLGMNEKNVKEAIVEFKGIERRLEKIGETDSVTIFDDYAHNPAKIAAALSAVSEKFGTVHAFWRPHGFKPLAQGFEDFITVFSAHWKKYGGSIFILPVYFVGGTVSRTVSSADLVERLKSSGVPAVLVTDYSALQQELEDRAVPGDAILGMGARDPELPLFAKRLVEEWKTAR